MSSPANTQDILSSWSFIGFISLEQCCFICSSFCTAVQFCYRLDEIRTVKTDFHKSCFVNWNIHRFHSRALTSFQKLPLTTFTNFFRSCVYPDLLLGFNYFKWLQIHNTHNDLIFYLDTVILFVLLGSGNALRSWQAVQRQQTKKGSADHRSRSSTIRCPSSHFETTSRLSLQGWSMGMQCSTCLKYLWGSTAHLKRSSAKAEHYFPSTKISSLTLSFCMKIESAICIRIGENVFKFEKKHDLLGQNIGFHCHWVCHTKTFCFEIHVCHLRFYFVLFYIAGADCMPIHFSTRVSSFLTLVCSKREASDAAYSGCWSLDPKISKNVQSWSLFVFGNLAEGCLYYSFQTMVLDWIIRVAFDTTAPGNKE